jgi:hypothetical protein
MQCHHVPKSSVKFAGDFCAGQNPALSILPLALDTTVSSPVRSQLLTRPYRSCPAQPPSAAPQQAWDVTNGDRCRNTAFGAARPRLGATGVCRRRSSLCHVGPPGSSGRSAASHRQQTLHWQQQLLVVGGAVGGAAQPGEQMNALVCSVLLFFRLLSRCTQFGWLSINQPPCIQPEPCSCHSRWPPFQGFAVNPCNSKLHPSVTEAGIAPDSDEEVSVQKAYTPESTCWGCGAHSMPACLPACLPACGCLLADFRSIFLPCPCICSPASLVCKILCQPPRRCRPPCRRCCWLQVPLQRRVFSFPATASLAGWRLLLCWIPSIAPFQVGMPRAAEGSRWLLFSAAQP